jgi:hypothetical protein
MKNFKITTKEENKRNIERVKEIKNSIKLMKEVLDKDLTSQINRNIKDVQQLEDEILINEALGLINLRMCQQNGIAFDKVAQALARQRK